MLRIVTYNIHGGTDSDRQPSLPLIAESLRQVDADIVLLQEVDHRLPRSQFRDQARWLATAANYPTRHFYGRLRIGPAGFGNAILTRLPIVRRFRVSLAATGGEPRCAAGAELEGGLVVYSVHLGLRDDWRLTQLQSLSEHIERVVAPENGIVLVGGDFNAIIDAPEVAGFLERSRLVTVSDDAATFPVAAPSHRIDFLFARGLSAATAGTRVDPGSDHCLVWADVQPAAPQEESALPLPGK